MLLSPPSPNWEWPFSRNLERLGGYRAVVHGCDLINIIGSTLLLGLSAIHVYKERPNCSWHASPKERGMINATTILLRQQGLESLIWLISQCCKTCWYRVNSINEPANLEACQYDTGYIYRNTKEEKNYKQSSDSKFGISNSESLR